ncbi:neural cell adhesion molecule 2 [Eurytemora carolleeae]|uniref:neural cell adhesion molecule 2 n=1 Tax=Eurytemora carolleeae TaxID=1294199 RepID=UPI000C769A96|nr:neural cell adhesion molecule 2 [Eurytemora carolleeae]|eukprot:XP_023337082.1 neural cell adhesion molecule 2-like [Eurytemora affinis]
MRCLLCSSLLLAGVLSKLEAGEGLSGYTRDRSESGWDEDGRIDASGSFAYSDLMILPSTHQEVRSGSNLVLTCRIRNLQNWIGSEALKLAWYTPDRVPVHNDLSMYTIEERMTAEIEPATGSISLFIKNIKKSDAGRYMCIKSTGTKTYSRTYVQIKVFDGLRWQDSSAVQLAVINTNTTIFCRAEATYPPRIDWIRHDSTVRSDAKFSVVPGGLHINSVQSADAGVYICRATITETGEMEERSIELQIGTPPYWIRKPKNITVQVGATVRVDCLGDGYPTPTSTWIYKPNHDKPDGELTDFKNGTLLFGSVTKNQEHAKLKCIATGEPIPKITWSKPVPRENSSELIIEDVRDEPGVLDIQDDVYLDEITQEYTVESTVSIVRVRRKDDGDYICRGMNVGGGMNVVGNIKVLFPPEFQDQQTVALTWHQKTVVINCSVVSLPGASLSWWHRGQQIGRDNLDRNFKIYSIQSFSQLHIARFLVFTASLKRKY